MGLPVTADQPRTVHRKEDRKVLETDIVDRLVIRSLEEGGIHREHRLETSRCEPCCKCHGVLLRDPHIEKALRESSRKPRKPRSVRHGRSDRDHLLVFLPDICQHLGKHICVGILLFLHLRLSCADLKGACSVEPGRILLRRRISLSLLRDDMDEHRVVHPLRLSQRPHELADIMSVHRPEISDVHVFKKHARDKELFDPALCPSHLVHDAVSPAGDLLTFSEMDMLLSLSTMIKLLFRRDALFSASYAMPPVSEPSPMIDTTLCF